MKHSKPLAYIRQLCCLGLAKETMILELLRIFKAIIPSEDSFFTGVDEHRRPAYVITDRFAADWLDVYLNQPEQRFTPEYNAKANQWFFTHRVLPDFRILDEQFYQRDFYHLALRPNNHHYALQGAVYQNGRAAGVVVLCRPYNQSPYEPRHQQELERMLPYVDHGLETARPESDQKYLSSGLMGLVILTRDGAVVSLSDSARNLLLRTAYGVFPAGQIHFNRDMATPSPLRRACANLDRIFQNQEAPPPVCVHTNGSGRFIFRAYWMNPPSVIPHADALGHYPAEQALIGVLIEHQEPLRLRLCRAMQGSRLSIREQEVCLALADQLSYPAIAARLNLSPPTVATYVRRIHEKLGVGSREELLKTLLAADSNAASS